jgi:hypothetical protein
MLQPSASGLSLIEDNVEWCKRASLGCVSFLISVVQRQPTNSPVPVNTRCLKRKRENLSAMTMQSTYIKSTAYYCWLSNQTSLLFRWWWRNVTMETQLVRSLLRIQWPDLRSTSAVRCSEDVITSLAGVSFTGVERIDLKKTGLVDISSRPRQRFWAYQAER